MKSILIKIYGIMLCVVIATVATILGGANIAGVKLDVVGAPVFEKMSSVVEKFLSGSLDYLGMVPFDLTLEKAVRNQKVVCMEFPQSKAAKAFDELAQRLLEKDEREHFKWGISQIFGSLLRNSKKA